MGDYLWLKYNPRLSAPASPSSFRLPIPNLGELDTIHPFSKYLLRVSFVPW